MNMITILSPTFDDWMDKVPFSFLLVASLSYITSLIESNNVLHISSQLLGGMAFVYFCVSYVLDFVIPKVENWKELDNTIRRKSITSWMIIIGFIGLFFYRGI